MSPCRNEDSPNPSLASECPPRTGGGGHTRLRVRGWGSPNSDDWRKSLALCHIMYCSLVCHLEISLSFRFCRLFISFTNVLFLYDLVYFSNLHSTVLYSSCICLFLAIFMCVGRFLNMFFEVRYQHYTHFTQRTSERDNKYSLQYRFSVAQDMYLQAECKAFSPVVRIGTHPPPLPQASVPPLPPISDTYIKNIFT
jgi:hypothetical protein